MVVQYVPLVWWFMNLEPLDTSKTHPVLIEVLNVTYKQPLIHKPPRLLGTCVSTFYASALIVMSTSPRPKRNVLAEYLRNIVLKELTKKTVKNRQKTVRSGSVRVNFRPKFSEPKI